MPKPMLLPISRTQFRLSDDGEAGAISEIVKWITRRAQVQIPQAVFGGAPYNTGLDANAPAMITRGSFGQESYWGARLREDDDAIANRSWHAEVVIGGPPGALMVAARLAVLDDRQRLRDLPVERSAPGFLQQIVASVGALDGDQPLVDYVGEIDSVEEFKELVLAPDRQLPVVAFGDEAFEEASGDIDKIAARLAGIAHVVVFSAAATRAITNAYAKPFTVFGNCAKLYFPIADPGMIDPFSHPIFRLGQYPPGELRSEIIRLAMGIRYRGEVLPRFAHLVPADMGAGADAETEIARLRARIDELVLEEEAREELLNESAEIQRRITTAADKQAAELGNAQRLNAAISAIVEAMPIHEVPEKAPPLRDISALGPWCALAGGDHLVLTDTFVEESERLPETGEQYLFWIQTALHGIASMVARKIAWTGRNIRLDAGVELGPCGSTEGFSDYSFVHDGERLRSEWHAKWGNGSDLRYSGRVYFAWDTDNQRAIIQSINAHFDNRRSN